MTGQLRNPHKTAALEDLLEQLEELGYRAVAICRKSGLQRPDECWAESHKMLPYGTGFTDDIRGVGPTRVAAVADLLSKARDA